MYGQLKLRQRREDGAVAIIVAVILTALLVGVAMVLDFGLVRVDRQIDKSAADAAVNAGLHGLNAGDGQPHPFIGVCTALRYLQRNDSRFSGLTDTAGSWTTGTGTATSSGCTDTTLRAQVCTPGSTASWAKFAWTGTMAGKPLSVIIQSGYQLSSASGWSEDALATSTADQDDTAQGCDQLAVVISQSRAPGLGSLATTSDLRTAVRSVGRVVSVPGGSAPAMLLLKQTGCDVLTAGSSAGGSTVHVVGALSANGLAQAGTIHSDSDGSGCPSNANIFTGQASNGIVAYAAPLAGSPGSPDPSKPGQITAYAATLGVSSSTLRDSTSNVCGSYGLSPSGTCPGSDVHGLSRLYRKLVDGRYLTAVKGIVNNANTAFGAANTYTQLNNCDPTQAQIDALNLTTTSSLTVNCTTGNGIFSNSTNVSIPAGTVVFSGVINPSAALSLPNATKVYIAGSASRGLRFNGGTFSMHTNAPDGSSNLSSGLCSSAATNTVNKAVLVVANGDITQSAGDKLQLCYTTVVMMGGRSDACLPATATTTTPPNPSTPCGGAGTGQLTQTGGNVDWTAPNRYDVMTLSDGSPDPARAGEWLDANGPEDLAFWSESGGTGSNPKYQMTGGGTVHLVGVLMTPNAQPFNLTGQFTQTLVNAQYVASSVALSSNNTSITMTVDPNSAVTIPTLQIVGLVR